MKLTRVGVDLAKQVFRCMAWIVPSGRCGVSG
jgi:hypothetical protein